MKKNYSLFVFAMILILSLSLWACTPEPAPVVETTLQQEAQVEEANKVVGIFLPDENNLRWTVDGEIMEKYLTEQGYRVNLQYANKKASTQLSQIQSMLGEGVNILVITPVDSEALFGLLKAAHLSGVLIIAYDQLIQETPDVDLFATINHRQAGILQASQIEQALGLKEGKGPFNIELFAGAPGDPYTEIYYDGSTSVLKPYIDNGQLVVQSKQIELDKVTTLNWDGVTARVRMNDILKRFYSGLRVDAVLCSSDSIALGILNSLREDGYGSSDRPWPVVTGQGAEAESVERIASGEQAFTVLKNTRELAHQTALMVDAALKGEKVPVNNTTSYYNGVKVVSTYEVSPISIDINNYHAVLVGSGILIP